ncbi:MAG: HAMP domain-containing protein [Firmicutes bacterium]|nr:HAMP domain-containing protein [Bacillota bacterium]
MAQAGNVSIWGRMPILAKVAVGFGVTLLVSVVAVTVGIVSLNRIAAQFDQVLRGDAEATITSLQLDMIADETVGLLWDYLLDPDASALSEFSALRQEWMSGHQRLERMAGTDQERVILADLANRQEQFFDLAAEMLALASAGRLEEALALRPAVRQAAEWATGRSMEFIGIQKARMTEEAEAARASVRFAVTGGIVAAVAAALGSIGLAWAIGRSVAVPLRQVARLAGRVSGGDLTVQPLKLRQSDEAGQVAQAFHGMVIQLRDMIRALEQSTDTLQQNSRDLSLSARETAKATQQITNTIGQVAAGTAEQGRSVQEVVAAVNELNEAMARIAQGAGDQTRAVDAASRLVADMTAAIEQVVKSAGEMAAVSERSVAAAREGGAVVRETMQRMEDMHQTVLQSADRVRGLGKHSRQVGEIVQVISDIAEQTNLLALNAAIEAARAGQHGKGFAVVADEVRKLADRSAASAGEISRLLRSMQAEIEETVAVMGSGTEKVQAGMERARVARAALEPILTALETTNGELQSVRDTVGNLSEDVQQVTAAMDAVARIAEDNARITEQMEAQSRRAGQAVESVAAVLEQTAASTEEISAAAEQMNASMEEVSNASQVLAEMAAELRRMVGRFRT